MFRRRGGRIVSFLVPWNPCRIRKGARVGMRGRNRPEGESQEEGITESHVAAHISRNKGRQVEVRRPSGRGRSSEQGRGRERESGLGQET